VCRDIKTDNILLDEYGEPVLANFGISVVLSMATHIAPTTIQGTFNYMAPEALNDQAEGGIGPHTDVWTLGCVIVEMITGKMPWAGMPMQQIITAVAMQFRVPTEPEGAPAAHVLRRCFAKAPRDRPTAEQLAEAYAPAAAPSPSLEASRDPDKRVAYSSSRSKSQRLAYASRDADKRVAEIILREWRCGQASNLARGSRPKSQSSKSRRIKRPLRRKSLVSTRGSRRKFHSSNRKMYDFKGENHSSNRCRNGRSTAASATFCTGKRQDFQKRIWSKSWKF
jgi:serine/threonine protein kinase